jgi:hypothetical protein
MDRLAQLSSELTALLDELRQEAAARDARELMPPLAWLTEANGWLAYELARMGDPARREPVPFTYIPISLRK